MQRVEQVGTVKMFERHLFVSTPTADWPPQIEESDGYLGSLARLLQSGSREAGIVLRLTAFHSPTADGLIELLSFPDRSVYRVPSSQVEDWARSYLSREETADRFDSEPVRQRWIFVCAHGSRDRRCGLCGPPLLAALTRSTSTIPELRDVRIHACSHVGGHRFAGNILIYPDGDWYGSVGSRDVETIVRRHLLEGKVVWDLWRGRAGLTPRAQKELAEARA